MWMKKQSPDRASSAPSSSCDKLCLFLALWAAGSALGELGLRQRLTHGDCSGLRSRQTWPGPGTVECKEKRLIKRIYGGIAHHCRWLLDVLTRRFVACWQQPPPSAAISGLCVPHAFLSGKSCENARRTEVRKADIVRSHLCEWGRSKPVCSWLAQQRVE